MGSIEEGSPVVGEYTHPVITEHTTNGDPWKRNHYAPPKLEPLVQRKYPLTDVRPMISKPGYSPNDMLKSHGFGVVKHQSEFLKQLDTEAELDKDVLTTTYYAEIHDLVMKTLGAKEAIIIGNTLRQGKRAPEAFKIPTELRKGAQAVDADGKQQHKLANQSKMNLGAPVRIPHNDFTPNGARTTIRRQALNITEIAARNGVIAAEDKICEGHAFDAQSKESDSLIAERYNQNGLGPRYAAYSIWRPLKKVGRDPITLAPRKREVKTIGGEKVYWPYMNRYPGADELGGDFLKEFAFCGVNGIEAPAHDDAIEFHYVSEQEPDEVLFIKLFDSASLGLHAKHASAPWHASPEIGDAAKRDDPRESLDIRVLAFW